MDKEVSLTSGPADYITLSDVARSYITANTEAFENGIYRPRAGKIRRFAAGFADSMLETRKLKDSLMIFGGQGAMTVGGLFGEDSSITQWGKELVRTGSRQIAAIDAENAKMGMDIADYEKETFSYKLGGGFASVVQMLLAGYATGGVGSAAKLGAKAVSRLSKASAVTVAAGQEISSEVQEGLQVYRERTGDQDLENYSAKEAGKEFFTTSGYAAAAGALESLNLTRVMPFLREGKKVIPNFTKGAFSEGVTEAAQELANIGFDLIDGTIDFSKMPDRLYGMLEQGLIGGLVGGTTAGAFSVYNRAKIKNYLREELAETVPNADLNDVVNTVYDAGIDTMAGIVTTELSHSESLRNKHGDIYRSMMVAIDKALNQTGSVSEGAVLAQTDEVVKPLKDFSSIKESALFTDESARAAYVSETAAMFADQVLAEANFRHVAIDDILKASDIVFEDGGIKFKTGTQTFDASGNVFEQAMFPTKIKTVGEFYDSVVNKEDKRPRYFSYMTKDGSELALPDFIIDHDIKRHGLSRSEIETVFENIENIESFSLSEKETDLAKSSVLLKINTPDGAYGVAVALGKNKNYISTVFKSTGENGVNDWIKKGSSLVPSSQPTIIEDKSSAVVTQSNSLNKIIKQARKKINTEYNQNGVKGSYSPYNRLIKITENADYSTLPHEFAHFWLSEMESWVNSGLASDNYMNRYDIAMDWLKAEAGRPLSRRVQERFARGYEQYLLSGNLPGNPMNPVYAEYDKWLKAVYNDMNQPSKKPLTTDMVRFFQSMTTGTLPATVLPPVNIDREREKEKKDAVSRNETVRSVETPSQREDSAGISSFEGKITPIPLAAEAKNGKVSAAAERQNRLNKISGLLKEDPQNVFYDPVTLEQSAKQAEMLIEQDGLDGVRQMIDGEKPIPENVIRTAVLIAYEQEMLKQGNTAEYLRVLRKHTLEQTRRGQEISAERINQDITNPSYWAKQALLGRKNALSNAIFERIKKEGDTKEKAVDRFVAQTASEYAEKLEKNTDKGAIIRDLNTKIKSISGKQIELFQKESIIGKTYDAVYDEIGRWIEECFDVGISVDEMNVLSEKTEGLVREFQAGLRPGENPSVEAMAKIKEMRETVAAMNPTNWLSLAVNSYGRAAMLSSPKSAILNILSNAETYATEAIVRRVVSGSYEKAVDPSVIKDYLKYDFNVYQKSGVMMSVVRPEEIIDPARRLLGENVMSSSGDGNFRKSVRFMERLVFNWGLGTPDAKAKALSFVDNAALEATKTAKAEGLNGQALTKRATELFKDACLYQPMTADGISIRNNSINAAEVATFTNNGKIAEMSSKVRNLINAATGKVRLGDFVMPFVKTPANVVSLGMEYSFGLGTAALHIPQILADVRAGTLSDVSRNVIRSSIRNGIGIALAALIASLFDPDDYISSFALASQKERDLVRFKNGVYNSIKIGNKYVSLDYFGPLAAPLVGWFEAKKARGSVEKIASFVKAAGAQLSNVPGVKELSALTGWVDKAVSQPTEKTLEDLWNGTADQILARTVPAIVSDVAKIVDPYERVSQDGIVGALASKIPGARQSLTAKADISTGREKRSENALSVLLFGARVKTAANNAMAREFKRLGDTGETPQLSDVARSFRGLTDKGKAQIRMEFVKGFVNQWGNKVDGYSDRVSRLIGSADYQSKTDAQKKEAINKIRKKMIKELKRKYSQS